MFLAVEGKKRSDFPLSCSFFERLLEHYLYSAQM